MQISRAYVLNTQLGRTTVQHHTWLRQFDACMSFYAFLVAFSLVFLIIAVKCLCRRKSFVYIELRDDINKKLQFRFYAFPNAT